MEKDVLSKDRYDRAQKRIKNIKGFYSHLFWYVAIIVIWAIVVIKLDATESFYQYGFWGMGYGVVANAVLWGIGLFVHWFFVFGRYLTFSKRWEDRKIEEFMKNDKN